VTKAQRILLEEAARAFDDNLSLLGRYLIKYLLDGKTTLEKLLCKYQAQAGGRKHMVSPEELRINKFAIYISEEEKQALSILADQGFYLPGELARILIELFLVGVIKVEDLLRVV
jgi:hypothetical protein